MDTKQSYFPWIIENDRPMASKPWAVKIKNRNNAIVARCDFASTCYTDADLARINLTHANLIIAAFDLLAAARIACSLLNDHASFSDNDAEIDACLALEEAIAKAEGRQHVPATPSEA